MMIRSLAVVAALATGLSLPAGAASAADLGVAPPQAYAPTNCVLVDRSPPVKAHIHHKKGGNYVRIYDVAPYDPRCAQANAGVVYVPPRGVYVPPQTAYLASSPTRYTECVWPCADAIHHDWYDGRLFYYNAGTPNRPDVFMVIKRD